MPVSKSQVAILVRQLSSRFQFRAKRAASLLDQFFYPAYGSGPRVVAATEDARIMEAHYGALRCPEVFDPLINALSQGSDFARAYAATILGHIRDERSIAALLNGLKDRSPAVRKAAVLALGLFFRAVVAVPALVGMLDDTDPEVAQEAASALGYIGCAEAILPLLAVYERSDWKFKVAALHAFAYICDPRPLPLVRSALFHKFRRIRKAAKFALSQYDRKQRSAAVHCPNVIGGGKTVFDEIGKVPPGNVATWRHDT